MAGRFLLMAGINAHPVRYPWNVASHPGFQSPTNACQPITVLADADKGSTNS